MPEEDRLELEPEVSEAVELDVPNDDPDPELETPLALLPRELGDVKGVDSRGRFIFGSCRGDTH